MAKNNINLLSVLAQMVHRSKIRYIITCVIGPFLFVIFSGGDTQATLGDVLSSATGADVPLFWGLIAYPLSKLQLWLSPLLILALQFWGCQPCTIVTKVWNIEGFFPRLIECLEKEQLCELRASSSDKLASHEGVYLFYNRLINFLTRTCLLIKKIQKRSQ